MKKFNLSKGLVIGLLTLALCFTCFGIVKASAEESTEQAATKTTPDTSATYDAATDKIKSQGNSGKSVVYVLKQASGNQIKAGTAGVSMANGEISLTDLGIKKTTADVYLYICDKDVEVEAGETVSATLKITGNANKVVGKVNYAQVDDPESVNVLSATYTNKTKKTATKVESDSLYWSEDQTTWYKANSEDCADASKKRKVGTVTIDRDGFTGLELASKLEAGATIYVKQAGTSGATGQAAFGSKVVKVKIAKQAKAPKAKIDVAKDTIALKNGFDFARFTKPTSGSGNEYSEADTWYTILPYLKTAAVKSGAESVVPTANFTPLNKKDTNAGKKVVTDEKISYSYTSKQYKAFNISELLSFVFFGLEGEDLEDNDNVYSIDSIITNHSDFRIGIRKSATEKKPSSAVTVLEIAPKAYLPLVWTQDNVKGETLVATATEFTKKGLTFGDIAAFPGYTASESGKTIATSGYDTTFKIDTAVTSASGKDDGGSFEYLVVDMADYSAGWEDATVDAAIDWTTAKWKKLDPAKLKITEKLQGAYSTNKGTKKKINLKAASAAVACNGQDSFGRSIVTQDDLKNGGVKTLILVRRAGDKSSSTRASAWIELYVVKNGKSYELHSTVSNGEEAKKYTVQFAKWSKASGASGYAWNVDENIEKKTVWIKDGDTKSVALDALTGAAYYAGSPAVSGVTTLGIVVGSGSGNGQMDTSKNYYIEGSQSASGDDLTRTLIVREGANVTVKAAFSVSGGTSPVDTQQLAKITSGVVGSSGNITIWVGPKANSESGFTTSLSGFAAPTGYRYSGSGDPTSIKFGTDSISGSSNISAIVATSADKPSTITFAGNDAATINTVDALEIVLNYTVDKLYNVTFDANGGTGSISGVSTTSPYTLPAGTGLSKANNEFAGWSTDKSAVSGGSTVKAVGDSVDLTADTKFYAVWSPVTSSNSGNDTQP